MFKKKSSRKTSKAEVKTLPSISYFKLFRYASKCDKTLIFLALISSFIAALMVPMAINLSANIFKDLIEYQKSVLEKGKQTQTDEALSNKLTEFSVKYISVAVVLFVGGYLGAAFMNTTAINQIFRIRKEYLTAALNQDLSYFDVQQTGDFASKISQDLLKLEEGINEKLSSVVYLLTAALSCISLALVKGWKLALIYLSSTPISFLLVGIVGVLASKQAKKEAAASSKASAAAEETLSAIRTVYSYNGQEKEMERYENYVKKATKIDIRKECLQGLTISLLHLVVFCTYGVGFYIGVYLVVYDPQNYDAEVMFEVFFGVITGMMNLGMIGTLVGAFGTARGAGTEVFALLDQVPTINPLLDRGLRPATVKGDIVFQDVHFHYPSRPEVPVLRGLNLVVPSGQSVALVGPSGSGKSTVIQLICRFYDVVAGKVLLDGVDVRSLSVGWLRAQAGLVGQEPVLFAGSVRDNIRHGRAAASDRDVEAAARDAFAHSFIVKLPKGYDTPLGQLGTTISGGQKQRIAIARALVRQPRLLLLDEATSALDAASESIVQFALDRVSKGRTTLTVAHRLSTIRNADNIYVLDKGAVAENGSHKELMQLRGLYYRMAKMQGVPDEYQEVERKSTMIDDMEDVVKPEKVESSAEVQRPPVSLWRLVRLNSPEWRWLAVGSACSVLLGFALPVYTVAFGKLFGAIAGTDREETMRSVLAVALVFVATGVLFAVFNIIESASFGVAGAHLAQRLRVLMFRQLLRQDVQYFDDESNSTGALCARLASETARIRQGTGQRIGSVLQGVGAVSIGVVLAFLNVWQAGLVALCFVPFVIIVIYFQIKAAKTESFGQAKALERSTKIAMEAITNVRTVASLGREKQVVQEYVEQLRPAVGPAKRMAHFIGAVNGMAKALSVLITAVILPYAARLMVTNDLQVENIVTCTQALQLSLMSVQNAFAHFPEFQKGILAGSRVLALLKTKPTIVDPVYPAVAFFECQGEASLNNVNFRYPTRPNNLLLNGFDLKIEKNKTIALVGESGCGKSTVMVLLQRFYDPEAGSVKLDNYNVRELLVRDVRKCTSVVAQEPVLFDRSLRDNIAYGDNSTHHDDADIERAAQQANIHAFIQSLPEGYATSAGSKGTQLSGGQKQRVAIARALLKNPKILLLDEATSALDAESEKVVQESLTRARAGRTCVLVAHRLGAVRDADTICVVEGGRVVEAGTHLQLLAAGGKYSQLHRQGT